MPPSSIPEQSIGFLLADVSRLLRRDFDRRVRSLELTQAQWRAIAHLARGDGIRQAALAESLEVKPITLTRLIDRLEAAGWVRRTADPEDRRASLLYLTPKAQPILDQMWARADEARADLLAGVPDSAQDLLVRTLVTMKQNLSEAEAAAARDSNAGTNNHVRRRKTTN
jgi:MarR family transcriptional regulator for hemolysin